MLLLGVRSRLRIRALPAPLETTSPVRLLLLGVPRLRVLLVLWVLLVVRMLRMRRLRVLRVRVLCMLMLLLLRMLLVHLLPLVGTALAATPTTTVLLPALLPGVRLRLASLCAFFRCATHAPRRQIRGRVRRTVRALEHSPPE